MRIGCVRFEHLAKQICGEMQVKACCRRMQCNTDGATRELFRLSSWCQVWTMHYAQGVQADIGRVPK